MTRLAEKLGLTTHDLSRIINTVLKTSFNDFINGYRVAEVTCKMQDAAYDHFTLEGIAYDSGFNSLSTFHRAFKQLTGETPAAYKKQLSSYNLTYSYLPASVISNQVNRNHMFKNYLKIAWRNTTRNKVSSFINISGLAVGMAVAMLIGLWIWDEVSFNKLNRPFTTVGPILCANCNPIVLCSGPKTHIAMPTAAGWAMNRDYQEIRAGQLSTRFLLKRKQRTFPN
ncbi:helix-turn-helix domain-containing protein [Mucilaginibacter sp. cycad4]|uniref:helix-turn-helix domain-containing protein n=1 Tax=Mucilaginibacter sp. cycad4 TaxID=3342096 RepID=UPI002AABC5FA|nr:helix-turn-helix domain-containing protein [Mucilaginibacter gossypii]WPV00703.1 helix-turn-helix domain-containing protein [Mucilaginibacter gossypii]